MSADNSSIFTSTPGTVFSELLREDSDNGETFREHAEELLRESLKEFGDRDDQYDADILRGTKAGITLKEASMRTGFELGVEYVRQLLVGAADGSQPSKRRAKGARG